MEPVNPDLTAKAIMVVEDDYLIAITLEAALGEAGANVRGPFPSVNEALAALENQSLPDAAVLDLDIAGTPVFPVAERLEEGGVPLVFTTGYSDCMMPIDFANAPRLEKPVEPGVLLRTVDAVVMHRSSAGVL